ncbi:MAG: efflux RND transporter periplasmic adaptor subunit, partial [Bacteroidota bacterium]
MSSRTKSLLSIAGILVAGVVITGLLMAFTPEAPRDVPTAKAPLVEVISLEAQAGRLQVTGTGTVEPTREVSLAAEVAGRIVSVSPRLVTGGVFKAGDVLVTVDPSDYENAVASAEAQVTQRHVELLQAEKESRLAETEWARLQAHTGDGAEPDSTALGRFVYREPQLKLAEASLRSAEAQLDDARTRLSRTRIRTPFSGRVRTKLVEEGQYVGPGQPVATLYATDEVELVVPLSSRQVELLDGLWTAGRPDVPAVVTRVSDGTAWDGYVHRVEGDIDPATGQINVVVRVPGAYASKAGIAPLLVGTFATVGIAGRS